jgi:lysosomal acid lipase/cholesteryl ester hydrolase
VNQLELFELQNCTYLSLHFVLECVVDGGVVNIVAGTNCCVNHTRFTYYLEWEPQPTSTKDMQHLAQMVRSGLFSFYDYGTEGNLKVYNQTKPPLYNLATIPKELPLFLISGGNDLLADPEDVEKLQSDLLGDVTALQIANYSHADLLVSYRANIDVNAPILAYFKELETRSYAS